MQFTFRVVLYHFSFPELRLQTIARFLLCRSFSVWHLVNRMQKENLKQLIQEIGSKAIQIDFAANHPESGWLAHIRLC